MIIQLESTCALGIGRQLLVALSIGMGVRTQSEILIYQSRAWDYRDISIVRFIVLRACRIRSLFSTRSKD